MDKVDITTNPTEHGNIALIHRGKHSGKFCIIIKYFEKKNNSKNFEHLLVCGISDSIITTKKSQTNHSVLMPQKMRIKMFVKFININHVIFTRHKLPIELYDNEIYKLLMNKVTQKEGVQTYEKLFAKHLKKINPKVIYILTK
uniref:Ribosomal protein L27 n=1 Tax=Amorphochlora amoebiformis TaxID=1561963 RepID=A0A0H5BHQ5_9EUKA|nr:ribosomal protein L27 [Amorphochlora amoebiformis]|mmetsp:Transcript_11783/g.18727  ORF Transcript_11783/g.18727 Transcript_11783/m.18727 type:complete len:143 (-) Transcript_11783:690-1118(-)